MRRSRGNVRLPACMLVIAIVAQAVLRDFCVIAYRLTTGEGGA